jgi:hypothetical protein
VVHQIGASLEAATPPSMSDRLDVASVQDEGWRLDQRQAGPLRLREPAAEPRILGAAGHQHGGHGLGAPQLVELGQQGLGGLGGTPIG